MKRFIVTLYCKEAITLIDALDDIVKTDSTVIASDTQGLLNDETMPCITFSSGLSFDEFKKVLDNIPDTDYTLCVITDWYS